MPNYYVTTNLRNHRPKQVGTSKKNNVTNCSEVSTGDDAETVIHLSHL